MTVRVRFAPSPTGQVHIGNIRVAIFNWLFARHESGRFLLRVEDTDRERSTPEAVKALLDAMSWLGLDYDDEPMYQSSRTAAHLAVAESLLSRGLAYKEDKGGTGKGECIVFRMPASGTLCFHDEIKGDIRKEATDVADFVIVRSNGTPVFHLANVVDDVEMRVTHVIRGDDHMENTHRHVALYQAMGAATPRFAHLPMIVNEQGKPYSKRDGAAFVGDFREKGYLPDALLNFLALLGWSPGEDREIMSRQEMIEQFDLARVKSGPARMDMNKFEWMQGEYMRAIPRPEFTRRYREALQGAGLWSGGVTDEYLDRVIELMQPRTKMFSDAPESAGFFFTEDYAYEEKAAQKRLFKEDVVGLLRSVADRFAALETFTVEATENAIRLLAEEGGMPASKLVHPVRVAVSGLGGGPGLFEMLALLGKERVLRRLERALSMIQSREAS